MSDTTMEATAQADYSDGNEQASLLNQIIDAMPQTANDLSRELVENVIDQALENVVVWDRNVTQSIEKAIEHIDKCLSEQMSEILHNDAFQKLEGSWLGLYGLVGDTDTGPQMKIKVVDFSQKDLQKQFEDVASVDSSSFFKTIYQEEYGTSGGEAYGLLIGDYEFSNSDADINLLRYMGETAAACHTPFIAAAGAEMFELDSFKTFNEHKPIATGFESPSYAAWHAFRDSDDARYVALTLPRTLARLPYGKKSLEAESFVYEEMALDSEGKPRPTSDDQLVWSNSAFAAGLKMTQAFSEFGWCTAIRGKNNGGKVENLPSLIYKSDAGDPVQHCPTMINITDEREKELSDLGFLPLVHEKNTNFGVFMGGQTVQKPKTYTQDDATANAAISARLPYVMAATRIAHYLKVIGRDNIGSSMEAPDIQKELQEWIDQYTNAGALGNAERARTPLAASKISVVEQPGKPGAYTAVAYLQPWLQMEELTSSIRMVAKLPG
ncbi:type VI secretion system contractile sheath large subunit [Thalassomonas sp. RHCl1]|uniref:type VI secretion system contractile sheath large subunit n=1 Tax=Thalassomonas sp. RHCl1 TaxID=2995320 RepID=UPI00248C00A5|nr:type VI secretion system contractile sheath large subunit [Thalassomonas sp. RHCl1]